ncbi:MAG: tRNA (guanosine(37)-N1)-methyltransferase TrmD [Thermoflexales bacterium]|nr:tRNA (guanosine(37)-N1)-methyltransferase TrmD [Thermoflexales bacterium]MDW8350777.1 tRNA (guanosine(37)-N1)-methyltransferase TrmD [Anaerolineae bacterium]
MRFDVFTLFPGMFTGPFGESIIKRAVDAGLVEIHIHNIRDYATGKHKITDDLAYGGGGGMVMKPEPIFAAVESVLADEFSPQSEFDDRRPRTPIILMSASGRTFTQAIAKQLAQYPRIALICGHYEGVDERVREHLCTDEISIGDYVLTGGELPAMVIIDAVTRLLPGVLPPGVPDEESHASGLLEYPHYTRPAEFRGWRVPDVLLSGNHAEIAKWRREQAERRTRERARRSSE